MVLQTVSEVPSLAFEKTTVGAGLASKFDYRATTVGADLVAAHEASWVASAQRDATLRDRVLENHRITIFFRTDVLGELL